MPTSEQNESSSFILTLLLTFLTDCYSIRLFCRLLDFNVLKDIYENKWNNTKVIVYSSKLVRFNDTVGLYVMKKSVLFAIQNILCRMTIAPPTCSQQQILPNKFQYYIQPTQRERSQFQKSVIFISIINIRWGLCG